MLAYHAAWDLHAFGLSAVDPGAAPGWHLLGHGVAGAFLLLSGTSLGVAFERGVDRSRMARRLVRIGLCALLITGVTVVLSPMAPVWFGILHCIAVTNLCALLLIRLRAPTLLALAGVTSLAPLLLRWPLGNAWAWTGLTAEVPASLDFRPVLPWLGIVLVGLTLGRSARMSRPASSMARLPAKPGRLSGMLQWSGRHSLALYLIHQPVLVGGLMLGLGTGWPATPPDATLDRLEANPFLQQCDRECGLAGGEATLCRSTCHCVLTKAVAAGRQSLNNVTHDTMEASVAACYPVAGAHSKH